MGSSVLKATLVKTGIAACVLLLANGVAMASTVTLTAAPTTTTLPDGQMVPMWGYMCGTGANAPTGGATCTAMTGVPQSGTTWQPPLITVPSGQPLSILLINSLSFGALEQNIPTSLVIVGQLGGGLGATPQRMPSPVHGPQGTTWPGTPGTPGNCGDEGTFCPPGQADRVRSFGTEVPAGTTGDLCWGSGCPGSVPKADLRPGTYLIHSGTLPSIQHPMGLYGVLVVTDPLATPTVPQAYGQTFDKDVALLLSEIDPEQNRAVDLAVRTPGFTATAAWSGQVGECGHPAEHRCYPPAVNYSPLYYLINGVSFDRSSAASSAAPVPAAAAQGRVLLRFVNAGLRMHVPSVVGANMTLLAEDSNRLPGLPRVQSSLFLAAGKTYDVTVQPKLATAVSAACASLPCYEPVAYSVFDRALGLSTNNQRDGGMQTYLLVNGGTPALSGAAAAAAAVNDNYFLVAGNTLDVADPAKGVIANDKGVYGVSLLAAPTGAGSTLTLNANGTFTYVPGAGITTDSFSYCANGTVTLGVCSSTLTATVALDPCTGACVGPAPTANADSYSSNIASRLQIGQPGVLGNDKDPSGFPLKASGLTGVANGTVTLNPDGSFTAVPACAPNCSVGSAPPSVTFQYAAINSQNTSSPLATVTVNFGSPSGLTVTLKDGKTGATLPNDYRWIIEEDRTVFIDPRCQVNSTTRPPDCPASVLGPWSIPPQPVRTAAINFHTSHTPVVAQGCVGTVSCEAGQTLLNAPAVCDIGNGSCRTDASRKVAVRPSQVTLDPAKRYYISILPGDGWITGEGDCDKGVGGPNCGHTMGGAQIAAGQTSVEVFLQKTPLEPAKISVFVFQDDFPLNGEHDGGGGAADQLAPNEAGLGGFNLVLLDQAGARGDSVGQITFDMFGMPVSNSLAGTIDPVSGQDACPISKGSTDGLVGMIVTCPKFMADGATLSPLAGHAVIANLYAGFYEVVASPSADRIARGEEWLQTNTLDGTKAIEAFVKPGEPGYFQEFGPGGFHVAVGFANPKFINDRKTAVCTGTSCTRNFYGQVTALRMSRTPDQRVYSSGSYDAYSFTQCYVSLGAPDSADFAFTKCNDDGTFEFLGIPAGNLRVTVFDQWNDLLVDGLSTPITNTSGPQPGDSPGNRMEIPITQWRTNLYGRVFLDQNGDGVSQAGEPGLPLVPFNIRMRDGSYLGFNNTDLAGYAGFNEVFPLINWLVVDIDHARHKLTNIHVVYDAGGPVDGAGGGTSTIAAGFANTIESPTGKLPNDLRFPGSVYCSDADCIANNRLTNPTGGGPGGSTGRIDPGWVTSEGWQGLLGQNGFIEFAMKPFKPATATTPGENGGIKGLVTYAPTRPFDDPALLFQLSWAPGIPNVKVNLYRPGIGPDGSKTLTLVDTTTTSSWDDWAQGFRSDGRPNMNCPGQETTSPFYYSLQNSTHWLNPTTALPYSSQFKCYDGWAMLNQIQPAQYNGKYTFPSVTARNPTTGAPTTTNCTNCITNPDDGTPMLPAGKYVVEVIVPQGYELVKEEDKNILMGDAYTSQIEAQQFAGFGNIFILPDQAAMNAFYNPRNRIQPNTNNGAQPRAEGDTGSIEVFWPCVGELRVVPDLNSLFPEAGQQAPFAQASRPLCDRKEVFLSDQMTVLAKFYLFSSTHVAGHYTGIITNDFASEFDPFSPQFGEKFAVPNTPVAMRDFAGKEISRTYSDQWGIYNGMNFSTWTVWPPSPSGYIPQMMVTCMNDPGPIPDPANPGQMITDPLYNPAYSNFCYEIPFMPGQTVYLDTPVVPTMAFAAGYNLPDCEYPDTTPAIKSVVSSDGPGPWVNCNGTGNSCGSHPLTINALGNKQVLNHAYSGPNATTAPFNQKFITRHYGFGSRPTTCPVSGACPNVTIAGQPMTDVTTWSDSQIIGTVPGGGSVPLCAIQQSGGPNARCGQLVITAANGKKSIDTVTVTIGGSSPIYVSPTTTVVAGNFGRIEPSPLQTAIDSATPGALIIVTPGTYKENLLMWKPVRLQGVGAESVIINADAHPAGKMDSWRRQVNCLFGLALNGRPIEASNPYDATGPYSCPSTMRQQTDRIPFEGIVGWDVTVNGNLAQMLQEPTLMGAYEGAGVTVLGKGVWIPVGAEQFGIGAAGGFPEGYQYLTAANTYCNPGGGSPAIGRDYRTSNFLCNPSRIDGISVINSSQGGGGIFAHGWNHNLEVANTRVHGNHGTLTGGITIGTGETPDPFIVADALNPPPAGLPAEAPALLPAQQSGYGFNRNVKVHHNSVTSNASIGDALFAGTNSGAGGVTICAGADNYQLNYNWVCGNLSTGDGGGVAHLGFSIDGTISFNQIIFNQSASPTVPTNGGGLVIQGSAADRILSGGTNAGLECGAVNDQDCPPGHSEGTGRRLLVDANLIMGNSAESGTGGGVRLQRVNGNDLLTPALALLPLTWNDVTLTNNIIANNVAGWDGGGVSMQDALKVRFINNTVIANDATASAGVLFNTLGAPLASTPPPGCAPTDTSPSCTPWPDSTNQVAGLVTMENTPYLRDALPGTIICPIGNSNGAGALLAIPNGACRDISFPLLRNNVFWQNRAFHIEVGALGGGQQNQQAVVTLVPSLNQATTTGQCVTTGTANGAPGSGGPVNWWDIGVRGDTGPTNHSGGYTLEPRYSILTSTTGYTGYLDANNSAGDPAVVSQYCNGSRLPPEGGGLFHGFNAPPGRSESTGLYPVFMLNQVTAAATVDEGNNWINLSYGPLSLNKAAAYTVPNTALALLGDYSITGSSAGLNNAATNLGTPALPLPATLNHDFKGNPRGSTNIDRGAVEFVAVAGPAISVGTLANFGSVALGVSSAPQTVTLSNSGTVNVTGIGLAFSSFFERSGGSCPTTATFTLNAGANCTIGVVFHPTALTPLGPVSGTLTISASVPVTGSPVVLGGTAVAAQTFPTLTVLDNFNRPNANTLGANWSQATLLGLAAIRIFDTTPGNTSTGLANANSAGNAYWNVPAAGFGARQAAAFTIANGTLNGDGVILKASGTVTLGVAQNFIRVRATGTQVIVETSTNTGVTVTPQATLTGTFASGDTLTAMVDAGGVVYVWKTTGATTTFIGGAQLPSAATWTGTGRIGMQLPVNARVDGFAGGTVP
jgi:hypothetical protein